MVYEYRCFTCNDTTDIIKPASEYDRREFCIECGSLLKRVDFHKAVFIKPNNFEPHFNHGLGKVLHSKRQMREEMRVLSEKTGMDIQEVGTDKPSRKKRQAKFSEETLERAGKELYRMRGY